jgi:hypothetical protein
LTYLPLLYRPGIASISSFGMPSACNADERGPLESTPGHIDHYTLPTSRPTDGRPPRVVASREKKRRRRSRRRAFLYSNTAYVDDGCACAAVAVDRPWSDQSCWAIVAVDQSVRSGRSDQSDSWHGTEPTEGDRRPYSCTYTVHRPPCTVRAYWSLSSRGQVTKPQHPQEKRA